MDRYCAWKFSQSLGVGRFLFPTSDLTRIGSKNLPNLSGHCQFFHYQLELQIWTVLVVCGDNRRWKFQNIIQTRTKTWKLRASLVIPNNLWHVVNTSLDFLKAAALCTYLKAKTFTSLSTKFLGICFFPDNLRIVNVFPSARQKYSWVMCQLDIAHLFWANFFA